MTQLEIARPGPAPTPVPVSWVDPIDGYLRLLHVAGQSPATLGLRRKQLSRLARHFPEGPNSVSTDGLIDWLGGSGWSKTTVFSHRCVAAGFFRWFAASNGNMLRSPVDGIPVPMRPRGVPRPVEESLWRDVRNSTDDRTALMIDLGALMGLRVSEIARMHRLDVLTSAHGFSLLVHGKGEKDRVVPMPDSLASKILDRSGWIFPSLNDESQHLSPGHVGKLISLAADGKFTAHQLRHRFATHIYELTGDILAVQHLLGHASLSSTQIYVQLSDRRLYDAMKAAA